MIPGRSHIVPVVDRTLRPWPLGAVTPAHRPRPTMYSRPILWPLLCVLSGAASASPPCDAALHPHCGWEAGEAAPGGSTTHTSTGDQMLFSRPAANLPQERQLDFQLGNALFRRLWASAPASTQAADGLGPLYNARACFSCHHNDGRGRPPASPEESSNSLFLRLSIPPRSPEERAALASGRLAVIPEPTYGTQLQELAVQGQPSEGRLRVSYQEIAVTLADGTVIALRQPTYTIDQLGYGPLDEALLTSPRLAPQLPGLGLLEAIPEADLLARADPADADGDGISGRPNWVWSPARQAVALGRFGWKAGSSSVDEQSQAAFVNDIGISTPLQPQASGDCSLHQPICLAAPNGNSPQFEHLEAPRQVTDLVALYTRSLALPARPTADQPQVLAGKRLFHSAGCAACHTPHHRTGQQPAAPELSNQLIWPYTDLLLHDLGEGLADHRPEGEANGREWRTPPLWGIGRTEQVNGNTFYLHDGRARSLLEAILWHDGEAAAARAAVVAMPAAEREALLRFLGSL